MTTLWVLWLVYVLAFFIDALYVQPWRHRQAKRQGQLYQLGALSFGLRAALPFFTALLLLRTFVIDVYHVPSGSMRPLLTEGSRIWVNRLKFGVRSPLTGETLIAGHAPAPGDVVVFQYPREPSTTFVKRIIGVPGDHIQIKADRIRVNGRDLVEGGSEGLRAEARVGERRFQVLYAGTTKPAPPIDLTVPPGHYFTLGDNLGHSEDSRYWGLLPDSHLLGGVIL